MAEESTEVVITVAKAVLQKSFEKFGKMDPYAIVKWKDSKGLTTEIAQTSVDIDSHKTPVWNYICRPQSYNHLEREIGKSSVILSIYDKEPIGRDDFCGSCQITVNELLAEPVSPPHHELPIVSLKGKQTGVILAAAFLIKTNSEIKENQKKESVVDQSLFVNPVKRLGVSGGTAPFFILELKNPESGQSPYHYIGKDLSHSRKEFLFYESLLHVKKDPDSASTCFHGLLDYTFSYKGVLTTNEDSADGPKRELLVVRNLHDGRKKLRLLDLKIGAKTADAGWQGKSWLRAKRQHMIDGRSNSIREGFRLEGFDGLPDSLDSMYPLLDGHVLEYAMTSSLAEKRLQRRAFQALSGADTMSFFIDLHTNSFGDASFSSKDYLTIEEYSELILNEVVRRLSRLSVICHKIILPQKWIGSSIAIGFDSGTIPLRSQLESVKDSVLVNIFDWGRSELNTYEKNKTLDVATHKNYTKFWSNYVQGVDRLSWAAARVYFHRYGNAIGLNIIHIKIFDYDSMSADDLMGEVILSVEETEYRCFDVIGGNKLYGTLNIAMTWVPFPVESRLQGVWSLFIGEGKGLRNMDTSSVSDPYCEIKTTSNFGHEYRQITCVRENTLNPVWNETLYLPVMRDDCADILKSSLESAGEGLGSGNLAAMFTKEDEHGNNDEGFDQWVESIRNAQVPQEKS